VCEPKDESDWRMAFLWRSLDDSRKEQPDEARKKISRAFGAYLKAVNCLAGDGATVADENIYWKYLRPNCTKILINGKVRNLYNEKYT
jgi:hypothetical protein